MALLLQMTDPNKQHASELFVHIWQQNLIISKPVGVEKLPSKCVTIFKKVNLLDAYTLLSSLSLGILHYCCVMRIVRECIYMRIHV